VCVHRYRLASRRTELSEMRHPHLLGGELQYSGWRSTGRMPRAGRQRQEQARAAIGEVGEERACSRVRSLPRRGGVFVLSAEGKGPGSCRGTQPLCDRDSWSWALCQPGRFCGDGKASRHVTTSRLWMRYGCGSSVDCGLNYISCSVFRPATQAPVYSRNQAVQAD